MKRILISLVGILISCSIFAQKHKPVARTSAERELSVARKQLNKSGFSQRVPSGIILPGEFEESQAVAISWSFDYDNNGNPVNLDTTSEYAWVSAQLADAISKECTVIIRVLKASDTSAVLRYMIDAEMPLTNCKFMPVGGDDWWTRDYGPMAFYSANLDSIGFVDMKYYDGRDKDDIFPQQLANFMGYPNYTSQINAEGGNLMTDGYGRLFFSTMLPFNNSDILGWTDAQTLDTLNSIFNTPQLSNLTSLECDGGTGHIDLYVKLIDEQTLIMSQYPAEITAQDKQIIEDNFQVIANLKSTYNRPFRILRVEHPTDDAGKHTRKTCRQIDADARNFINGLTVNNSFIFPSYTDGQTGNLEQHQRIMEYYQKAMPGYSIVPIDSRDLSPLGGAIHCITMQIPTENPIRFWHPSVDGIQPNLSTFPILAKIDNKSGIKTAKCIWRKNQGSWNTVNLRDSSGFWVGSIQSPGLEGDDAIFYYLEAESNNGKTARKPFTAAKGGYYKIMLKNPTGEEDLYFHAQDHLFSVWPNPAKGKLNIRYQLVKNQVSHLEVYGVSGNLIYRSESSTTPAGMHQEEIDATEWTAGIYIVKLVTEDKVLSKKLIIE